MTNDDHEPDPISAFHPVFISRIQRFDWPVCLAEALLAGPWTVSQLSDECWIVRHEAETAPFAICQHRETALMIAAVLPGAGREPVYELVEGELMTMFGERGFESIASLTYSEEQVLGPLHTAHCILSSPVALAFLLLAAPAETLDRAGLLAARLAERLRRDAPSSPATTEPEPVKGSGA